jgi:hypothetical protein
MSCVRHLIVCEGESEWAYLQRLQGFLDQQTLPEGAFETPLRLVSPPTLIARSGKFGDLKARHGEARRENRKASIQIWTDFDLYHRDDHRCATSYRNKPAGLPDFLFSFHNFEDFLALHCDGDQFDTWLAFGRKGHFAVPWHAEGYLPEFEKSFPGYAKGQIPVDFINWRSLTNLKRHLPHQPTSNPEGVPGIRSFAEFLVCELEQAYPGSLG